MDVWVVIEHEPPNPGEDFGRTLVHSSFRNETQALRYLNSLCWDYAVEDEAFGEEVARIIMKDTAPLSERDTTKFYKQVWWERFEPDQHSRFEVLQTRVF